MKVILNKERCIGCGICEENVPEIFRMGSHTAELKKDEVPAKLEQAVRDTIEDCPAEALSF